MPELPEVEFCRRALLRWTRGRHVVGVEVADGRSIRAATSDRPTAGLAEGEERLRAVVTGAAPGALRRHGKRLAWFFGERALILHLGMTGKWTLRQTPHWKVSLRLDTGGPLYFSDPRLLGGIVPTTAARAPAQLSAGMGPDALDNPLPVLRGRRPVKVALMDQSVVAGLGNLHAMEALWRARLHPAVPAQEVVGERHAALHAAIQAQLCGAIAMLEREDEIHYVEDAGGENPFPIYQRDGEPCPRCGTKIERMMQAGRSTYWCPECQRV